MRERRDFCSKRVGGLLPPTRVKGLGLVVEVQGWGTLVVVLLMLLVLLVLLL